MSDDFQQRGGSPWGTPPGGGSGNGSGRGPTPPDVEKIAKIWMRILESQSPATPARRMPNEVLGADWGPLPRRRPQ